MKITLLFILCIILLGLILCNSLKIKMWNIEGLQNQNTTSFNASNSNSNYKPKTNWDNYNHYKQSTNSLTPGQTFHNQQGGTISVSLDQQGEPSLQITLKEGEQPVLFTNKNNNNNNTNTSSGVEAYTTRQGQHAMSTTFYGPQGETATIVEGENGQNAIRVQTSTGTYTYTQYGNISNTNGDISSTQYYGSTGSVTGPQGNTAYYAQGPQGNTAYGTNINTDENNDNYDVNTYYGPNGGSAGSVSGPQGNTAYYTDPNLQNGINKDMIPPGQEDLYILKSEIVPPVCPACPVSTACPREEPCPACPACARCPEPSFECKKVPNYNTINDSYLPVPVLNDFSRF